MRRQSGFSMIELMVAMTVTLIVSAAIYGLLTSGGTAFRREPEMADRQQNIRMAMDLIARDVFNAGSALPTFSQVFSITDPAGGSCTATLNGCGVEGSLGGTAAAARGPGDPGGDPLTATDVLEIVSTEETCPVRTVCSTSPVGGSATTGGFVLRNRLPACASPPGLVMLTDGQSFALHMSMVSATSDPCPTGGNSAQNGNIRLGPERELFMATPILPAPTDQVPPNLPVVFFYAGSVVRYRIAPNNDPLDPGPALWRSRTGMWGSDGAIKLYPGESTSFPEVGSPWELVARGIEDLQIEYMRGDGLWYNSPPTSVDTVWDTLVRQVRITLSARANAPNLQGATIAAGTGPDAIRGQLVTAVTPRAAFNELQMCLAHPTSPCPATSHIQ